MRAGVRSPGRARLVRLVEPPLDDRVRSTPDEVRADARLCRSGCRSGHAVSSAPQAEALRPDYGVSRSSGMPLDSCPRRTRSCSAIHRRRWRDRPSVGPPPGPDCPSMLDERDERRGSRAGSRRRSTICLRRRTRARRPAHASPTRRRARGPPHPLRRSRSAPRPPRRMRVPRPGPDRFAGSPRSPRLPSCARREDRRGE